MPPRRASSPTRVTRASRRRCWRARLSSGCSSRSSPPVLVAALAVGFRGSVAVAATVVGLGGRGGTGEAEDRRVHGRRARRRHRRRRDGRAGRGGGEVVTRLLARRALAAAGGLALDRALGEPPAALHPVAAFGRAMGSVEEKLYRDSVDRRFGVRRSGESRSASRPGWWRGRRRRLWRSAPPDACFVARPRRCGPRSSSRELGRARARLSALCGRDPSGLDESGVVRRGDRVGGREHGGRGGRACALGRPVRRTRRARLPRRQHDGRHGRAPSARYQRFGRCAARLDDLANLVPARLTAVLVATACPSRAAAVQRLFAAMRRAIRHRTRAWPKRHSPPRSTCELGGVVRYGERVERRPRLGNGRRPKPADISRAVRLADRVEIACAALLATSGLVRLARRSST